MEKILFGDVGAISFTVLEDLEIPNFVIEIHNCIWVKRLKRKFWKFVIVLDMVVNINVNKFIELHSWTV